MADSFKVKNRINLAPTSTANAALGDLSVDASDSNKLKFHDGSSSVEVVVGATPTGDVVGTDDTQTLTNKTIDADANTISNIENADIKSGAAIARNKLASGTASHVLVNDGSGVMTSEATLAKSRGGAAADMTDVTFPSTGVIVTEDGSQTLTNKTLTSPAITTPTGIVKGDVGLGAVDNTSDATKDAAVATLTNKTLTAPVINSPTGIVKGDVGLGNVDNTSDATKNAAAVTLTNKTIDADSNTITNIENADIKAGAAIARNKLASGTASHVVINDGDGVMTSEASLAISRGGTGQATAQNARNALLPDQSGQSGLFLQSDGTDAAWASAGSVDGGDASAPGWAPAGDLNTGMFSDTADQLGFSTAGVERLRISSTGAMSSVITSGSTLLPMFGIRAWATIDQLTSETKTGTYSRTLQDVTVSVTNHGFLVGHVAFCDFTSGTATDGAFVVTSVTDANTFNVTHNVSGSTSGNITLQFHKLFAGGNVSSVSQGNTTIGTASASLAGRSVINFTVPMPDANYSCVVTGAPGNGRNPSIAHGAGSSSDTRAGQATGYVHVGSMLAGSAGVDMNPYNIIVVR